MEGLSMNYSFTFKSVFCTLILGAIVASAIPATQALADATSSTFFSARISEFAKNNKTLCLASIALPIFGLYARKTIHTLIKRSPHQQDVTKPAEEIDYFDRFTDAFSKTTTLVGKIFKVICMFTASESNWWDAAAKL
jgi:hypothetical protein